MRLLPRLLEEGVFWNWLPFGAGGEPPDPAADESALPPIMADDDEPGQSNLSPPAASFLNQAEWSYEQATLRFTL
jgi:hypothetical protein